MSERSQGAAPPPVPQILESAGQVLGNYDVIFSDVWGVIHDGFKAFRGACDALEGFRRAGGTVILVSNAPVPAHRVAEMLDQRRVPREAWDHIVSSGEIALSHLSEKAYESAHLIGPRDRDHAFFAKVRTKSVSLDEADAIVCTGLEDDARETVADYEARLERGVARGLPFVCVNPDLVVDVGGKLYLCAGALADRYQRLGGEVYWAGKPYAAAYEMAHRLAEEVREAAVSRGKILVIGDALRTDVKGAEDYGVDAMFIAAGIHRDEVMRDGRLAPEHLSTLFSADAPRARWAMSYLSV